MSWLRLGYRPGSPGETSRLELYSSGMSTAKHPANELHQKAGVLEGLCGLSDAATFQQVIEDYQIVVLSSDHFNAIVYEGPRREKQIYLYHQDNHFDIITSVSSFLGKSY